MLTMERDDIRNAIDHEQLKHEADFMNDILIVDDDPIVRHFLRRMLHIQGYACVEVTNGQEAIEHLHAYPSRLIIADHQMPEMNGMQLLENISDKFKGAPIPVILMTRDHDHDVSAQAKRLGVHTVISKPLDYRKISIAVASVLS